MEKDLLIRGLAELGIPAHDTYVSAFTIYLDTLIRWNRAYNLTSLHSETDIITKHFLDSLLYLTYIPPLQMNPLAGLKIGDVGSGAGFPGIPLGIVRPDLTVSLVEPSRKKSAFLRHIIRTISLRNISVVERRIEACAPSAFDIVVSRALFSLGDLARKACHTLKEGGFLILSKGPKVADELPGLPARCKAELRDVRLDIAALRRTIVKVTC